MIDPATEPRIMGILNVTPDSFYDGGRYTDPQKACRRGQQMIAQGAEIIDIGGESTGPGSQEITPEEEMRRVLPVLKALREEEPNALLSIDTYRAETAKAALTAGANMINDVTAGRGDPRMFDVIAESGCRYVFMRSKDHSPRTTALGVQYGDVLKTIHVFFEERISAACKAGIRKEQLILDPGLGHFVSSTAEYSWTILEHLEFLQDFGCPILVSPSRKSFTAGSTNLPLEQRLAGTLKATKTALEHGATIIRTHDVRETHDCLSPLP